MEETEERNEREKVIYCISIKNVYSVKKNLKNEALVIGKMQKNRTHRDTERKATSVGTEYT